MAGIIDLAVMCKETYAISALTDVYTISLISIPLSYDTFKSYFFVNGNFTINKSALTTTSTGFVNPFTFNDKAFTSDQPYYSESTLNLYNCILELATNDLGLTLDKITPGSKIEINKEVRNIDLGMFYISSSLKLIDIDTTAGVTTYVISAVISNKNNCIKPIIVKFYYDVTVV